MIRFDERKELFTNPGDPIHQLYSPRVDSDGNITLVKAGVENTDYFIQSFAEETDINVLISRMQNGDFSMMRSPGVYGDFSTMPKTYAEVLQLQIDATRLFDSLPADVKQKFDHDKNKFFAQSGTIEWYEKIESVLPDDIKSSIFPGEKVEEKVNGDS